MATELPDLHESPTDRLADIFDTFIKQIENTYKDKETNLDAHYVRCKSKIYNLHKKTVAVYEELFKDMTRALTEDGDAKDALFFERYMRSKKQYFYRELFQRALPELKKAEENNTCIQISIKEGTGSFLHGDCGLGYYDDWEDDSDKDFSGEYGTKYTYEVTRRLKTKAELEFDKEMRENGFVVLSRPPEPSNPAILKEYLPTVTIPV
jgi:hypothetical protein